MKEKPEFHPIADVFPLMTDEEFTYLCEDIRRNDLREDIWLWENKIVDGRNRYNACVAVGVTPRFRRWNGKGKLSAFVISLNLHRRHLSESQRAFVAARLANLENGQRASSIDEAVTQAAAAKLLNVSKSSVERAGRILRSGVTDLAEMIEDGNLSVGAAVQIAALPKTKQKRLIIKKRNKIASYAAALRVEKTLKKSRFTNDLCLICNHLPKEQITEEKTVAFFQVVAAKLPGRLARYLLNNIEEIEEMNAADEMPELYEKVLLAIDAGHMTYTEIQKFTRIEKDLLDYTLSCMCGASIEEVPQGGKAQAARGAPKMLWQRKQLKTDFRDDEKEAILPLNALNLLFSL